MQPTRAYPLRSGNAARDLVHGGSFLTIIFLAAHIPLALLMQESSLAATVHALLVLAIGVRFALSERSLERVAVVGAYIVGAEVLWRMTQAKIFWEFGKYALVLVFALAMFRGRRLKGPYLPLFYFALLLPSMALTITQLAPESARKQISFNLSGPLTLLVSAWFYSQLQLSPVYLRRILLSLVAPVIGIASIAISSTVSADTLNFATDSNFVTSGGFGPNQVSAMLGLAVVFCLWYILDPYSPRSLRPLLLIVALGMTAQSLLTFSRTGIYLSASSLAAALIFLIRDSGTRIRLLIVLLFAGLAINYIILPELDRFTDGMLRQRYQDASLTGRDQLWQGDLRLWSAHPVAGVGPGMGLRYRLSEDPTIATRGVAPHTEFSRMLAEHGTLGLMALLLLLLMVWRNFARQPTARSRAFVALLLIWSLLFMVASAMRLAAPSLLVGLSFATLINEVPV